VKLAAHPAFQRGINHLVLLNARFTLEARRNNSRRIMIAVICTTASGKASLISASISFACIAIFEIPQACPAM
jgi:hypothetical protein